MGSDIASEDGDSSVVRDDKEKLIGRLAEEFLEKLWSGQRPTIEQFAVQHPAVSDLIKEVFPTLLMAAEVDSGHPSPQLDCPCHDCEDGGLLSTSSPGGKDSSDVYVCYRCGQTTLLSPIEPDPGTTTPQDDRHATLAEISSAIGRYKIKGGKLGEGGFGTVWLADDGQRWVAIKIPRKQLTATQWQRYVGEVQVHANLPPHPNIVALSDYGKDGDTYFIVLEFKNAKPLSVDQPRRKIDRRRLMLGITSAIAHLHGNGIAHRDISPRNILVDCVDEGIPYVLDFGLAKCFRNDNTYLRELTVEGQVVGNQRYMSPEQRRGEEGYDLCRSDVFSLGVIFYELLTGQYPFAGSELRQRIANKDDLNVVATPIERTRGRDSHVCRVIEKCLLKNPSERFSDAIELELALLNPSVISRRPIDFLYRFRHGLSALALTALVAVGWLNRPEPQPKSVDPGLAALAASAILEVAPSRGGAGPKVTINGRDWAFDSLVGMFESVENSVDREFAEVEGLTVSNAKLRVSDSDLKAAKKLTGLEFFNCELDWQVVSPVSVEYLFLSKCSGIKNVDLSSFRDLKYLQIRLSDDVELVTGLEQTTVEWTAFFDLPELRSLSGLGRAECVRSVEITECPRLGEDVAKMLEPFKLIRTLNLSHCELTNLDFLASWNDLQSVALSHLPQLEKISSLSSSVRRKRVNVDACPSIDWRNIDIGRVRLSTGDPNVLSEIHSVHPVSIVDSGEAFWAWREQMIQKNVIADRYYDEFVVDQIK